MNTRCTENRGILFHKEWARISSVTTFYVGLAGGKILSGKISQFIPLWQLSFLTKPAVVSPELKDCCEPFLHLWPWRYQKKLGAVVSTCIE